MGGWSLPQPLLLGAVAAVATTVAWLHTRREKPRARELEEQEEREMYGDGPRPKRTRWSHARTNKWDSTWGKLLLAIRSARVAGTIDGRLEAKFKERFRLPFDLFEKILLELRGRPGWLCRVERHRQPPAQGRQEGEHLHSAGHLVHGCSARSWPGLVFR